MNIHYFQHVPFETPAMISRWAAEHGYAESFTRFYEDDYHLPDISDYDALIILGGPMSVHDEVSYPWLAAEKTHIKAAIDAGKHVLGICLGAQLIAEILSAKVAPQPHKEIGVFPIAFLDDAMGHRIISGLNTAMNVLHWHGDRFDIPEGVLHLARSKACDNQAFLYNNTTLALQFHIEMDMPAIEKIIEACGHELTPSETIQSAETIYNKSKNLHSYESLKTILNNWVDSH